MKLQQRKQQLVLIFVSPEVVDEHGTKLELHTVPHWCKIIKKGQPDFFFNRPAAVETSPEEVEQVVPTPEAVLRIAQTGCVNQLDCGELSGAMNIDDDTQPLPENIPDARSAPADDIMGEWGHNGVCERRKVDTPNRNARLIFEFDFSPTAQQLFELLFLMKWVKEVLLVKTNKQLEIVNDIPSVVVCLESCI